MKLKGQRLERWALGLRSIHRETLNRIEVSIGADAKLCAYTADHSNREMPLVVRVCCDAVCTCDARACQRASSPQIRDGSCHFDAVCRSAASD